MGEVTMPWDDERYERHLIELEKKPKTRDFAIQLMAINRDQKKKDQSRKRYDIEAFGAALFGLGGLGIFGLIVWIIGVQIYKYEDNIVDGANRVGEIIQCMASPSCK
jgi:hypothetical protein